MSYFKYEDFLKSIYNIEPVYDFSTKEVYQASCNYNGQLFVAVIPSLNDVTTFTLNCVEANIHILLLLRLNVHIYEYDRVQNYYNLQNQIL